MDIIQEKLRTAAVNNAEILALSSHPLGLGVSALRRRERQYINTDTEVAASASTCKSWTGYSLVCAVLVLEVNHIRRAEVDLAIRGTVRSAVLHGLMLAVGGVGGGSVSCCRGCHDSS